MGELVRLQRYLASAGVAARRKAEQLITAGRVTVNGEVVTTLGTKVDPDTAEVTVDGEAVMAKDAFYVLLNKPKACITAVTDDRGRPTVMDYLPNVPVPVKPVGRLDFYSEGVLLLTNDGELAAKLLAPASHVAKTYHVKVHGQLSADHVKRLREGITLDDGATTMPAEINVLPGESKHTWLGITIHEGKHRQIHRMIEALGYQVDKLQRVAFANLTFHDLRVGDARELNQQELNALRDLVGLDHSTVARGRWRSEREETDVPRRARAKARDEADAAAAENEANRLRNVAARAEGGDAWDGEGDPDRNPDGVEPTEMGEEEDDMRGAPMPAPPPPASRPRGTAAGKPYESRAVGRRDPDDPRAARGGPRERTPSPRDDRGASSPPGRGGRGGPAGRGEDRGASSVPGRGARAGGGEDRGASRSPGRGGRGEDRGPGSRAPSRPAPRSGEREVRQYSDRTGARGGDRSFAPRSDAPRVGGGGRPYTPRGDGPRSDGPRGARSDGPRGARSDGPRSDGPRSDGPRSGGPRSDGPRGARSDGPRSDGPRGRSDTPRVGGGGRPYTPRGDGPRSDGPRGRSDGPRVGGGGRPYTPRGDGPRGDGPRVRSDGAGARGGERSFAPRGDGPRGPRSDGPRSPRSDGPRSRSDGARGGAGPRGGERSFAPRGDGPRGGAGAARGPRSDGPRGARSDGPRGGAGASRDKGRWRDRESGPRSRDEVAFGPQEPDQKPRGAGARAPGPSGAKRTGQGRSYGSAKPGGRSPRRG